MTQSKKTHCFEDLKNRILSVELAPGADLDEVNLSSVYGISRTPLREVLQLLSGEGYVKTAANRGSKVASMDVAIMRTFFQTAPLVYANISRLAAENRDKKQINRLKEVQTDFKNATAANNPSEAAIMNFRFHAIIGEMAHNPYLKPSLDRMLIDHTRLGQTFYRPASAAEKILVTKASQQHDALISAIEAMEPALAVELTLQHWDLSRDRLERFARPDPLPIDVVQEKGTAHAV